jgi:hypothetical protein
MLNVHGVSAATGGGPANTLDKSSTTTTEAVFR